MLSLVYGCCTPLGSPPSICLYSFTHKEKERDFNSEDDDDDDNYEKTNQTTTGNTQTNRNPPLSSFLEFFSRGESSNKFNKLMLKLLFLGSTITSFFHSLVVQFFFVVSLPSFIETINGKRHQVRDEEQPRTTTNPFNQSINSSQGTCNILLDSKWLNREESSHFCHKQAKKGKKPARSWMVMKWRHFFVVDVTLVDASCQVFGLSSLLDCITGCSTSSSQWIIKDWTKWS